MPNDVVLKTMNAIHRSVLKLSGGRLGWTADDMPVLELTTIGRKSGEPRSVMLSSPHQDGDALALVASRGGDDHHPAWFLNLRDNPAVKVRMKDTTRDMTARIADEEERAELWPKIIDNNSRYAGYQSKTEREIPVVLLEPME